MSTAYTQISLLDRAPEDEVIIQWACHVDDRIVRTSTSGLLSVDVQLRTSPQILDKRQKQPQGNLVYIRPGNDNHQVSSDTVYCTVQCIGSELNTHQSGHSGFLPLVRRPLLQSAGE